MTPGRAALAVAVLVVLALTLVPNARYGAIDTCGWCSADALADAVRNLALFAPLGVLLVWNGWRPLPAVGVAALLSAGIEVTQFIVPGRHPSMYDVLTNTGGALGGVLIARAATWWWRPPRRRALLLAAAGAIVAATVWLGAKLLLRPAFPRNAVYFGQWTAQFEDYAWYGGHVTDASLADMSLPSQALERSDVVRAALLAGAPLRVHVVAGPTPRGVAPIFSLADSADRFILMIAADGADLLITYRTRGAALRLDQPPLRIRHALRGARHGVPLLLTLQLVDGGACVTVDGARSCPHFSGATGWALLGYPVGLGSAATAALSSLWSLMLVLPSCYWLRCAWTRAR